MHGDGTGSLTALLPAEQAVAAWQTLDHEARCRRSEGDERAIDALMCDLLVERVTGQATASNLNLEVGVVIAASSLLGADQQPAKLVGHRGGDHGVLPAGLARRLADSDTAWLRRLICDPIDGRLLSMDPTRRRFDGALRRFVIYRDSVSRRPYSNTPIYDIDHITRYTDDGLTVAANAQGLGKTDHTLRDLPAWSVTAPMVTPATPSARPHPPATPTNHGHHPSSAGATHHSHLPDHATQPAASSSNSTATHSPSNTPANTTDNPTPPDAAQG